MTRTYYAAAVACLVLSVVLSALLYPRLPDIVPTHWNIHGVADGFGPKAVGVFLMPGIMALMMGLFLVLPRLSPRQFGIEDFRSTWLFVMVAIVGMMAYIHLILLWTLWRGPIDMLRALVAGLFLFFALVGNVLGKVKRNFWLGVRTPWTLASERVWIDTHRLTARLFVALGALGVLLTLAGMPGWLALGLLIGISLIPVVYSLVLYKRLERRGEV